MRQRTKSENNKKENVMTRTLKQIAIEINQNAKDSWDEKIDWKTFDQRAKSLWREVDLGQLNIIGSRTYKRMGIVQKYLNELT